MSINCDENLECVICNENLVDPRALPCGHSYCGPPRLCLSTMKKSEGVLQCAVCRVKHNLKLEDIKPLYGIRDFFQGSVRKKTTKTVSLPCPVHESNECTIWCNTCCAMICIECFGDAHDDHSMRDLRKHLMRKIEEKYGKDGISQYRGDLLELIESKTLEVEKLKMHLVTVQHEIEKIQKQIEVLDEGSKVLGRETDSKFGKELLALLRLSEIDLLKKELPQHAKHTLENYSLMSPELVDADGNPICNCDCLLEHMPKPPLNFPFSLLTRIPVHQREPLLVGRSDSLIICPFQFWITCEVVDMLWDGRKRKVFRFAINFCHVENGVDVEYLPPSTFHYGLTLNNLEVEGNKTKKGTWEFPKDKRLLWCSMLCVDLIKPESGWILDNNDIELILELKLWCYLLVLVIITSVPRKPFLLVNIFYSIFVARKFLGQ